MINIFNLYYLYFSLFPKIYEKNLIPNVLYITLILKNT